ncbi:helix-turn-helix domain-containing protein [Pseudomonas sp. Gutcm_11s]|uniref:helix-turn-helix domain-containing protein n=1 Tax=Pseudomonas sp. Gutcm_11s TaxID=3026088 RepID=UPI0023627D1F|nr:AraC family transcriptional regulator [Pseudomonas sp. Gutcm_11s]MDD0842717.1 AraC family transcriptional regulator [Pseudomonas sp. Gutcm_11s]
MHALAIPAAATLDTQTYNLIVSLQAALEGSEPRERDTVSEVGRQLCRHLLERYQQPQETSPERLSLAPWQERKAKEMLARSLTARLFIADVAEQCAMSRSHFSRAFKKTTGMSPQEWSLDLRVRRAKELLRDLAMPISVISLECGFADQSHFSRMFGKLVGTTPKRWRQLNTRLAESA